jgi:hypothetical protein
VTRFVAGCSRSSGFASRECEGVVVVRLSHGRGFDQGARQARELLTAKTVEVAAATKVTNGASLSVASSQAEEVEKLELTPNEVKLEGVNNYLSWSRRGLLLLKMRVLEGYVLGEVDEPVEEKGGEWKK